MELVGLGHPTVDFKRRGKVDGVSKGKGRTSKMELIGGGIQEVEIGCGEGKGQD